MDCTWKHIVSRAKLLDLSQSLKLWGVDHLPEEGLEGDLVVDTILDVAQ